MHVPDEVLDAVGEVETDLLTVAGVNGVGRSSCCGAATTRAHGA